MQVTDLRVFIPSKDFALSKAFYQQWGFEVGFESDELCELIHGECSFFLQNFYHTGLAENLMMQLVVGDIEQVANQLGSMDLASFAARTASITELPHGKVLYLWGPAGELWHITEFHS
ncbi:hypothetical protein PULV_a0858 [Pseudoalteromonas ulvae UL12]|uniref:lactoylglutathione lyase n=1 Tax=Pseudoalteromonas ulvae TaxID=107327 RepID=UPI00186BACAC|nr:lactoylglutathione lyase [Pseudoalteromonas ulvae]MBE0363421.1 hypothetical protein [Pseudoalteromonas ulvae UL12]